MARRKNFYHSGPFYLTAVDWKNLQHKSIVAASLVKGTYSMEHDRQKKLQGHLALAPPWWEFFNFQLVEELHDVHDQSIFGAIFEFKFSPSYGNDLCQKPPRYVVAFRGTVIKKYTWKQDLILDFQFIRDRLHRSTRFQLAMQAVQNIVSNARDANIWLAGHSLGSAIALEVGKNMVKKEKRFIGTYLFNPPFPSFPIERVKNEKLKHGIRFTTSVLKAGVVVTLNSQLQRSQKDHSFKILSEWIPHLFVNPSDPICAEYIGYFEHREKMVEVGVGNIATLVTQNSLGNLILGDEGKDSEPPHLIPSAYLTINVSPTQDLKQAHGIHQWWGKYKQFKQAHGIHQWWEQNINCQFKQHQYR